MSNKEKCISTIEAEDDFFCEKLYMQYEKDREKDIAYSEEEVLKDLGIAI